MFYLLIGLMPLNCVHSGNLWLYGATMFYWLITLLPRVVVIDANEIE